MIGDLVYPKLWKDNRTIKLDPSIDDIEHCLIPWNKAHHLGVILEERMRKDMLWSKVLISNGEIGWCFSIELEIVEKLCALVI